MDGIHPFELQDFTDNMDSAKSDSVSRVELDILQQKDRIFEFIDFMNKKAESTKEDVLAKRAIEYWTWKEPLVDMLIDPERKLKPIVVHGDREVWGSPSFWEERRCLLDAEECEEEEYEEEDRKEGDDKSSGQVKGHDPAELERVMAEEHYEEGGGDDDDGEEEEDEDEEEEEEEDDDEEGFVDDYVYCYFKCVSSPDGYVVNSTLTKNCFHPDQTRLRLIEQLRQKYTVYTKVPKVTDSRLTQGTKSQAFMSTRRNVEPQPKGP